MNELDPRVSVIVPCYNYGHFVLDALKSVAEQSYRNWECIIVNDGSTDDSAKIIADYIQGDPRFTLINVENSGVSSARNTAILRSSGKYLFPLDADNKMHPLCLEKCILEFQKGAGANVRLVYPEAEYFGKLSGKWELPPFDYPTMLKYNMIDNSCMFLREDFDRVGGYRTNMVHGLEDWDFFIALLYGTTKEQVVKIPEPLYYYRTSDSARGSMVVKQNRYVRMTDNIIYNNFSIYQEYFPDIFTRIHAYDFDKTMLQKKPVKMVSNLIIALSALKAKIVGKGGGN